MRERVVWVHHQGACKTQAALAMGSPNISYIQFALGKGNDLEAAVNPPLIELTFWVIPPFVSFLTLFALAGLAVVKGRGRKVNLLLAGICFLGGLLSLDKALASVVTDPNLALRISRIDHIFVVFFIPVYLHFTYSFLGITTRKWLVRLAYVFSGCLSLLSQGDYHLSGVKAYFFGYYAQAGPMIYVFGVATTTNTLYCLYLLFRALRQERDPDRKNKTKYIILGLGGAALMAHFDLLPLAGISFYPLGNFAFIPILLLGFAVLKHDLLDIGFMVQKGLTYSVLTGLLTGTYALMIIMFNQVFKGMGQRWSMLFAIFFFLVIVFVFEPLKKRVQLFIDRLLFKGKYDYQKTLMALSDAMASMLNLDEIMDKTLRTLTQAMYLDWGYVMLADDIGDAFRVRSQMGTLSNVEGLMMTHSSPLIRELARRNREVSRYNVEEWSGSCDDPFRFKEDFNSLGGTVILPVVFKGDMKGLLVLGNKKSGDLFTAQDFELLRTLANQCAIAIENAKSYQLIENLNENLEAMVDERTEALKKALEEKDRTQELLIRSESLAAVGALVAGVAHELNNPLASVSSLVQSAVETMEEASSEQAAGSQARLEEREELIDDLKFSLKELNRAKDIVASLLGISRQTQEYSEPVILNDVSRNALKVLYNQYKRTGIEMIEAYEDDLPEIRGNFSNLGQVCLNIITNAIQAVDSGQGRISLRTRYDQGKGMVIFECEDNGPGISEEVMKDIFKPFYTTKEVGKGTGLGLYISYEIVRRHNGNIFANNNARGGATFRVQLPVT
ncbi:MAG: ATP-binding protein [Deltaproteobacteria bacterium]|jgi:two-component system NtrC family sensor kinase